jgi:hypothetical protein
MTLLQPFKLKDIQTKALAVCCAILIMLLTWSVQRMDRMEAECRIDKLLLASKNDSINRIMYMDLINERRMNRNADSILRSKTQKQVEDILSTQHEKFKN